MSTKHMSLVNNCIKLGQGITVKDSFVTLGQFVKRALNELVLDILCVTGLFTVIVSCVITVRI